MVMVNVHEAKTQLSRLLARVAGGEEVVIARAGKPVARLLPVQSRGASRAPGSLRGRIHLSEHFDEPLPEEELDAWEGGSR